MRFVFGGSVADDNQFGPLAEEANQSFAQEAIFN
jgi:hypothetical protein